MTTFKEFLSESNNSNFLIDLSAHKKELSESSTEVLLAAVRDEEKLSNKQAKKFSNELSELVHSEDFITELSSKLPSPQQMKSKSEYVDAAKAEMKTLLIKKLVK